MSNRISVLAAADITKGRAVKADGTVASALTDPIAGFAFEDASSGEYVTLVGPGAKVRATAGGSVSDGDFLVISGSGYLVATGSLAGAASGVCVAGTALEDGTTGNPLYVQFAPFFT